MSLVRWSDELSVGVPSLDEQHKKMLVLLNELHEGMMAGKDKIALGGVLNQLIAATAVHIRYEDSLKTGAGNGGAPRMRELLRQVCGIRHQYETIGPSALTLPVMSFLKNGLMAHIRGAR